jgi:putative acetyltransferase
MSESGLTVAQEDPSVPDAVDLLKELSAELKARYDEDGAAAFDPADAKGPRSCFLLARQGGRAVGSGAVRPYSALEPHIAEFGLMYVRPEARGHHVAREVLRHMEEAAARFGYTHARLETGLRQHEALNLYVKAGYSRIPRYGRYAKQALSACFEKKLS